MIAIVAIVGRGCCVGGSCCDPTTYVDARSDETSGPVRARVVIERGWHAGTGKLPAPVWRRIPRLVIAGNPEVRVSLSQCGENDPEVRADAEGKRIAYRCDGGRWRVVYRRGNYAFEACAAETQSDDEVDWSRVPTWTTAVPSLFACAQTYYPRAPTGGARSGQAAILAAERSFGDAALVALLIRVSSDVMTLWPCGCDAWIDAARALPETSRTQIVRALAPTVADVNASPARLWRSIVMRGLEGSDDVLRAHATRLAARSFASYDEAASVRPAIRENAYALAVLAVLLRAQATRWGAPAGEIACSLRSRIARQYGQRGLFDGSHVYAHLAIVVGAARARCPGIADDVGCGTHLECEPETGRPAATGSRTSVPCTADVLHAELAALLAADPVRAVWFDDAPPDRAHEPAPVTDGRTAARIAYSAAFLGGTVPDALARKLARLHYRIEPREGPECSTLPASRAGEPCRCHYFDLRDRACVDPPEALRARGDSFCDIRTDDANGVVHQVRAACLDHERCDRDDQCCEGTICLSFVDGGTRFCRTPPRDAGPPADDASTVATGADPGADTGTP